MDISLYQSVRGREGVSNPFCIWLKLRDTRVNKFQKNCSKAFVLLKQVPVLVFKIVLYIIKNYSFYFENRLFEIKWKIILT